MLQCALVGAWHVHFDEYATAFQKRENCKITCLWDDDVERGKTCAAKYNAEFVDDYDALLARNDVDCVIVCSATNLHTGLIIKAANAQKHIYTEKVLCFTKEDALKIKDAVDKSGIKFCISFPKRCDSRVLFAKQAIQDGLLGDVYYARVRNAHDGSTTGWLPEHFYDETSCGGGAMMDLGAHPMYLLPYLMGSPKSTTSLFTQATGRGVDDNAVSLIEFENGAIGCSETAFVSKNCPLTIELSGSKGTMYIGGKDDNVVYNVNDSWEEPTILPDPLKMPIDQWVDAILYGGKIEFSIDAAVALTVLMEKAYESYRTGKKVLL